MRNPKSFWLKIIKKRQKNPFNRNSLTFLEKQTITIGYLTTPSI